MPTINLNNDTPAAPSGETNVNWQAVSPPEALAIIGVSDSGGLFEIELGSTDYLVTNDSVVVVCPAFAAIQGQWQITVVDPTHCTLNGSTYSSGWTGYAGGIMLAARDVSAYMPLMVGDGGSPPTGGASGAVPAPPPGSASAGEFLRADGTWAVPAGSGITALPTAIKATISWIAQNSLTFIHNLGTTAVIVQVYDASGNQVIPERIMIADANHVTLVFGAAFTGSAVAIGFGASPKGEYSEMFAAAAVVTITHDLNTTNVIVQIYDASGNQVIPQGIGVTSANAVTLTFGGPVAGSAVVIGLPTEVAQFNASWTSQTSVAITHNLNTTAVIVQVYDASGNQVIPEQITVTSSTVVTLTFGVSFTGSAVVIG